jgi:hypothetical protein
MSLDYHLEDPFRDDEKDEQILIVLAKLSPNELGLSSGRPIRR